MRRLRGVFAAQDASHGARYAIASANIFATISGGMNASRKASRCGCRINADVVHPHLPNERSIHAPLRPE